MNWIVKTLGMVAIAYAPVAAQAVEAPAFYTLGTGPGPRPKAHRAQPANLLIYKGQAIMVDAGDGAAEQLGKIGIPLERVNTLFISHLHFDHTGGLFALISRRFQILAPGKLVIYGPPGTKATVDALLAAMEPAITAQSNIRARAPAPPKDMVEVIEIGDGWHGDVAGMRVSAASNSHYVIQSATDPEGAKTTYAFRFDMPERSIVYTGDTGPSTAIETLAKGADMLVAELMDPVAALADLRAARPDMPAPVIEAVSAHFNRQHLSPIEAGLMANRAGVKSLVITHNAVEDDQLDKARREIGASFKGPVTFASDLQKF